MLSMQLNSICVFHQRILQISSSTTICYDDPDMYRIAQNFGGVATARNWQRKLWRLAEAKPIQYLSLRDLTTFWMIKLWRISNKPPNPPSFLPPKFCAYDIMIINLIAVQLASIYLAVVWLIAHPTMRIPYLYNSALYIQRPCGYAGPL